MPHRGWHAWTLEVKHEVVRPRKMTERIWAVRVCRSICQAIRRTFSSKHTWRRCTLMLQTYQVVNLSVGFPRFRVCGWCQFISLRVSELDRITFLNLIWFLIARQGKWVKRERWKNVDTQPTPDSFQVLLWGYPVPSREGISLHSWRQTAQDHREVWAQGLMHRKQLCRLDFSFPCGRSVPKVPRYVGVWNALGVALWTAGVACIKVWHFKWVKQCRAVPFPFCRCDVAVFHGCT